MSRYSSTAHIVVTDEVHSLVQLIARGDEVAGERRRTTAAAYREVISRGLAAMGYELEDAMLD